MKNVKPRKRLAAVLSSLLAIFLLATGCTSSGGDVAACKAAMTSQYAKALSDPSASPGTKPEACKGLTDDQIAKIAEQILGGS